jgi:CHRD domain
MTRTLLASIAAAALAASAGALAHDDPPTGRARLSSYQEVPAASSAASARFVAKLGADALTYELSFAGLESDATQSHIHFGQRSVNGGVAIFLCSNLGNGPAGTQPCPLRAGTIAGTITPANVIGPTGQGISAGEWAELLRAMRAGVTYVNLHTVGFPGGEVRGQIQFED